MTIEYGSIGYTLAHEYNFISADDTKWDPFTVEEQTMVARLHSTEFQTTIKFKYKEPEIP